MFLWFLSGLLLIAIVIYLFATRKNNKQAKVYQTVEKPKGYYNQIDKKPKNTQKTSSKTQPKNKTKQI
jgi:hypothetical protein